MSIAFICQLIVLAVLVGFSAFFSAAETALFSLSKAQLQHLRHNRPARGEIILFLLDHPRRVLSTILLGNTAANTAACILALDLFHNHLGVTIVVMILLLLIVGEIVPKTFAIQNAENTVNLTARPIYWMTQVSTPVRTVLEKLGYWMVPKLTPETFKPTPHITQDEFRTMIDIGREQGVLQESERKMIRAIMTLGNKTVKEVMTPRVEMVCLAGQSLARGNHGVPEKGEASPRAHLRRDARHDRRHPRREKVPDESRQGHHGDHGRARVRARADERGEAAEKFSNSRNASSPSSWMSLAAPRGW